MPKIRQPKDYHRVFSEHLSTWDGVQTKLDRYITQFGLDHLLITDGVDSIAPYLYDLSYLVAWMKEWNNTSFVYQRLRLIDVDTWLYNLVNILEKSDQIYALEDLEEISILLSGLGFDTEDAIRFHQICLDCTHQGEHSNADILYTLRIGMVYLNSGHRVPNALSKAEKVFLDCLASCDTVDIRTDLTMIKLRNELAVLYSRQGDLRKAYDLILEVTDDFRTVLGQESQEYLVSQTSIAWLEQNFGDLQTAKMRLKDTVTHMKHSLGNENSYTLGAERQYLQFLQNEGKLDEGKAIQFKQKVSLLLGKGHNLYFHTNNILGLMYLDRNQYDKAEQIFREMVELSTENIDPMILTNLALALQHQGMNPEAAQCYEDSLQRAKELYGDHYLVAQIAYTFADFLWENQQPPDYTRAENLYKSAKTMYTNTYDAGHAWVRTVLFQLSDMYEEMDDIDNAALCLRMYLDEAQTLLSNASLASFQYYLGRLYTIQKDIDNAKTYLLQALSYRRDHKSNKPHLISNALWYLYKCAYQESNISQMFLYLEEALQLRMKSSKPFSENNTFKIASTLCERYLEFDRLESFQELFTSMQADTSLSDEQLDVLNNFVA
jgi:tetratricopeptide (TPR) repeat protein